MNQPLVSGIIIFLNGEKFIEEAIASVFAQTYDNWELLLVDDGSTDGSTRIAREYADNHPQKVRYLEHDGHENRGMGATRNLGVRHAKGEYIAFLDGDDVWLTQKLEQQVRLLESKPEAAAVIGPTQHWYSWTGKPEDSRRNCLREIDMPANTLFKPPLLLSLLLRNKAKTPATCSVLIRREVFAQTGGFEESFRGLYELFEDRTFFAKMYLKVPVFVTDEYWDRYRQHADSACHVAQTEGNYHPYRLSKQHLNFLQWLEDYLSREKVENGEVWQALRRALRPYRNPFFRCLYKIKIYLQLILERTASAITPQRILHLELSEGVPALSVESDHRLLYVVFWWYGIPLGSEEISSDRLPITSDQLADIALKVIIPAIEAHLLDKGIPVPDASANHSRTLSGVNALRAWEQPMAKIREELSKPMSGSVSVVVCTRNRPEHLSRCLQSLRELSPPPDEIVVVDNAPASDKSKQIVAQMAGVRYVLETKPGLDFARNTGINQSRGEIIAFTDDDVTLHANWVAQLRHGFRRSDVMAVTGLVLAAELDTLSQLIFEKYWSFNRGYRGLNYDANYFKKYQLIGVPSWRIGAGANMAFRRKIFSEVGNFDERLDVGAAGCSGDSELWYRVLARGWTCRYQPTAVAYHCHRREMTELKKQIFYYMRGHVAELFIRFERYRRYGEIVRLAVLLPHFTRLLLFGFSEGILRYSTLPEEIAGSCSGAKFYFLNQRSATSGTKKT